MDTFETNHAHPAPLSVDHLNGVGYESALAEALRVLSADPVTPLDAVVHGITVRLHTNNTHWRRFWTANWFAPHQWATLTGGSPPTEPRVHLYATAPDSRTLPWAGYSPGNSAAFLTGDTSYGPLRALALGAVARLLAEEEAVHFVPGICVKRDGQGVLLSSPPGVAWEGIVPALMESANTYLVALDGVFIRYGLVRMVDGVTLLPTLVIDEKGTTTYGYRLFPWLDEYGFIEPRADARCLTLRGEEVYCFSRDLDLARAPEAMAFPPEQAWYVPTHIVAVQPHLVGALCPIESTQPDSCGVLENVPPFTPDLMDRFGQWAREAVSALSDASAPSVRALFEELGKEKVVEALCCLRAAPHGRAMVLPERLWPGRAGGHPWRPLRIEHVALLESAWPTVLEPWAVAQHLGDKVAKLFGFYDDDIARALTTLLARAIGGSS